MPSPAPLGSRLNECFEGISLLLTVLQHVRESWLGLGTVCLAARRVRRMVVVRDFAQALRDLAGRCRDHTT